MRSTRLAASCLIWMAISSAYIMYSHFRSSFRCFGPKCGGCGHGIIPQDYVRKARDKVYHLRCFTCSVCAKQLSTGEVLYLQPGDQETTLLCKDDYLKNHGGGIAPTGKRASDRAFDPPDELSVPLWPHIHSALPLPSLFFL